MKGKILTVPFSQQGITQVLFQNACDLTKTKDFSSILYIASTPRKVKETRMQFSQWVNAQAFIPPQFFTIKDFAIQLYNDYGNRFILPDFLKPVLIQSFSPKTNIGYAQRLANFIKEIKIYLFRQNLISIKKEIENLLAGYEHTLKRINEAFAIFQDYNQILNRNGWLDSEDVMQKTPTLIKHLNNFILILDAFYDLTPIEEEILKTLILQSKRTIALAYFDEEKKEVYKIPLKFLRFLQGVTDFEMEKWQQESTRRNSINYYGFSSLEEEVEGIARAIKKRYIENNLDLNKTVVTFSQLSLYAHLVERIFPKYGIPYTLIPKKNLLTSPLAISIIELLKTINEDFPRISMTITLTNPFFSNVSQTVKNYSALFAKRAKIAKGKENWFYLEKRFETYFENDIPENEQALLKATEKGVRQFLNRIKTFDKGLAKIGDWVSTLKDLLNDLGLLERIVAFDPTLNYEYKLIIETLNQLQALEADFSSKSYTLAEFTKLLNFLFNRKEYELDRKEQGIRVIDLKDTVGLDFDDLFFGGLIEGKFPNRPTKDPLLSEAVRKHLGLPDIDYHFKLQELDYFRLTNSTKKEPFLTYACEEADQLLLPSPFLQGTPIFTEPDNYLLSEEEVLRHQGQLEKITLTGLFAEVDFSQDKNALDLLQTKFGAKNYFSVTELEKYRQCPFAFYIENVLELTPEETPSYDIDAMFWGKITHRVFELLYKDGAIPIQEIESKTLLALETVLEEEKLSHFWREVCKKIFSRIIPEFIKTEEAQRREGFVPYLLEKHLRYELEPNLRIKGRFDRIDRSGKKLRILDYKTGQAWVSIPEILEYGTHLQLPLYARLMQLAKPHLAIDDIGIYSLRDMKIIWLVKGKNNLNDLITAAINFARNAVGDILGGKFKATPSEKQDCRNCDYYALCPNQQVTGSQLLES